MQVQVSKLLEIDRILMQMSEWFRFKMEFCDVISFNKYADEVGGITDELFRLQRDHFYEFSDENALRDYHDRLMSSYVEFDYMGLSSLISKIGGYVYDAGFRELQREYLSLA